MSLFFDSGNFKSHFVFHFQFFPCVFSNIILESSLTWMRNFQLVGVTNMWSVELTFRAVFLQRKSRELLDNEELHVGLFFNVFSCGLKLKFVWISVLIMFKFMSLKYMISHRDIVVEIFGFRFILRDKLGVICGQNVFEIYTNIQGVGQKPSKTSHHCLCIFLREKISLQVLQKRDFKSFCKELLLSIWRSNWL